MPRSSPSSASPAEGVDVREVILLAVEEGLRAQLAAIRRLRAGRPLAAEAEGQGGGRRRKGRSQVNLAYDILVKSRSPLHISTLLQRIEASFEIKIDRESLVSALSKRVARKDRFQRTGRNTFALLS